MLRMLNRKKIAVLAALLLSTLLLAACGGKGGDAGTLRKKTELMKEQLVTEDMIYELGSTPAEGLGHAVFLSVCDTETRASVYSGTGEDLESAWDAACKAAEAGVKKDGPEPVWVKADVVYLSEAISMDELNNAVGANRNEFLRYGVAFDAEFKTALLEAELNGNKIYDYEEDCINLEYLNRYLKKSGRTQLAKLPENCIAFQTFSRFCDENNTVYKIDPSGLDYGRRQVELVDADYAEGMIATAAEHLAEQVKEDGSFVYGYYPRFDNETSGYNILRHAGTVWSLICRYRMTGDEELAQTIDLAIEYMLSQLVYADEDTAYLYEATDDEIKLGGCGIAVVALTEYMDAFGTDKHLEVCRKMGNGILALLDQEDGTYYHVLNGDFTEKEEFRTVYYDGEATFALCRLYSVTGEEKWLDAAKAAVDHFIEADYVQHRDQWVAYSMNEITKYVDDEAYFVFALRNVQENYENIKRDTTAPVCFELLMTTFEMYDRMIAAGAEVGGFDEEEFLRTIYSRAERMLDGYFYPEYAMYMEAPSRVLGAFMVREDGFRTRIDDVQHCIGGYYLYHKHYDRLVEYGMLDCIGK